MKFPLLIDDEELKGEFFDLLLNTLTSCENDFKVMFNDSLIDIIAPNPYRIRCVFKVEPFPLLVFLFFKSNIKILFKSEL